MTIPTYSSQDLTDLQPWEVIDPVTGPPREFEQRASKRRSFTKLLRITPTDRDGHPIGVPFTAIGKNISSTGIGFYHQQASNTEFAVIQSFEPNALEQGVLTRLVWCRFCQEGIYDSGGEFLGIVATSE